MFRFNQLFAGVLIVFPLAFPKTKCTRHLTWIDFCIICRKSSDFKINSSHNKHLVKILQNSLFCGGWGAGRNNVRYIKYLNYEPEMESRQVVNIGTQ